MKYMNSVWVYSDPFFVLFKKHFCPLCDEIMFHKRVERTAEAGSPEAKEYAIGPPDVSMFGTVKFSIIVFVCSNCDEEFTVRAMIRYEKANKAKIKELRQRCK
jgi:ribosomal protein L37AE/L43A